MTTRHIYPEQDATLIVRVPASLKSWFADLANLTLDRNMSDFARDALRAYMLERGGEVTTEGAVEATEIETSAEPTIAEEIAEMLSPTLPEAPPSIAPLEQDNA